MTDQARAPSLASLAGDWRSRAVQLRAWGCLESEATMWDRAADEVEHALRSAQSDVLNLHQAALESGYSPRHLSRKVHAGDIPNVGTASAPKIRRADLPEKPGYLRPPVRAPHIGRSPGQIARALSTVRQERG